MALSSEISKLRFDELEQLRVTQDFNITQALVEYTVTPTPKPRLQSLFGLKPNIKPERIPFLEVEHGTSALEILIVRGDLIPSLAGLSGVTCRALKLCFNGPSDTSFVCPIRLPKHSAFKLGGCRRSSLAVAISAKPQWKSSECKIIR